MSTAYPDHDRPAASGYVDDPADGRSIGELIGTVTSDFSKLMRQEVELAKAEAKESASLAGKGIGMLAGAAVGALLLLMFLSLALMWALGRGLDWGLGWGAFAVAVLWAIVAAVLAVMGKNQLTNMSMRRTQETAAKIPDALKGEETR